MIICYDTHTTTASQQDSFKIFGMHWTMIAFIGGNILFNLFLLIYYPIMLIVSWLIMFLGLLLTYVIRSRDGDSVIASQRDERRPEGNIKWYTEIRLYSRYLSKIDSCSPSGRISFLMSLRRLIPARAIRCQDVCWLYVLTLFQVTLFCCSQHSRSGLWVVHVQTQRGDLYSVCCTPEGKIDDIKVCKDTFTIVTSWWLWINLYAHREIDIRVFSDFIKMLWISSESLCSQMRCCHVTFFLM